MMRPRFATRGASLPSGARAVIRRDSWPVPKTFRWLQRLGEIEEAEMERVFNMGIGLVVAVSAYYADSVRQQLASTGLESWPIGHIAEGERGVVWG